MARLSLIHVIAASRLCWNPEINWSANAHDRLKDNHSTKHANFWQSGRKQKRSNKESFVWIWNCLWSSQPHNTVFHKLPQRHTTLWYFCVRNDFKNCILWRWHAEGISFHPARPHLQQRESMSAELIRSSSFKLSTGRIMKAFHLGWAYAISHWVHSAFRCLQLSITWENLWVLTVTAIVSRPSFKDFLKQATLWIIFSFTLQCGFVDMTQFYVANTWYTSRVRQNRDFSQVSRSYTNEVRICLAC